MTIFCPLIKELILMVVLSQEFLNLMAEQLSLWWDVMHKV